MGMGLTIAPLDIARADARDLLARSKLQTADIDASLSTFFGATAHDALVGVIGLERRGPFGLVRSMAVEEVIRHQGIARQLYERAELEARNEGLTCLYALTETAEAFFHAAGFERVSRADAPPEVAASTQFAALCPASAALLRRLLV